MKLADEVAGQAVGQFYDISIVQKTQVTSGIPVRSVTTQDLRVWKQAMIFNPVLRASAGGTLPYPEQSRSCHIGAT